ncbi:MAG: ankyrin repeat domain-containing protein [Sphingomonadales bacterium]|nr:ankyrin repeat domain-containing protein [Sphingomonadales bacterium]
MAAALAVIATPAAAQFSKSYKFLEAVKDKDGQKVTDELSQPGATLINTQDVTTGQTALHIVVARRDSTWVSFLLGKGADPNVRDFAGVSPLVLACNMGFSEAVELLLAKGARVDEPNATGETPLIASVHRRDMAMMRLLLKAGANPDRADSSGRSARDYAALDGRNSPLTAVIDENVKVKKATGAKSYGPKF